LGEAIICTGRTRRKAIEETLGENDSIFCPSWGSKSLSCVFQVIRVYPSSFLRDLRGLSVEILTLAIPCLGNISPGIPVSESLPFGDVIGLMSERIYMWCREEFDLGKIKAEQESAESWELRLWPVNDGTAANTFGSC
jgi:hypothetical protein